MNGHTNQPVTGRDKLLRYLCRFGKLIRAEAPSLEPKVCSRQASKNGLIHSWRVGPSFTQCRHSAIRRFYISPLFRGKDNWPPVVTPLSWSLIGMLVAIDMICLLLAPLKFANSNLWIIGALSLGFLLWIGVFRLIFYRLKDDMSHQASALRSVAHGGDLLVRAIAFTTGHLEKSRWPGRREFDSLTASCNGGRASHGADGLFRSGAAARCVERQG